MGWPVWFSWKSRLVELPCDTTMPDLTSGAKPGEEDAVISYVPGGNHIA
jgi:hypothetical protein